MKREEAIELLKSRVGNGISQRECNDLVKLLKLPEKVYVLVEHCRDDDGYEEYAECSKVFLDKNKAYQTEAKYNRGSLGWWDSSYSVQEVGVE